MKRNGFTLVEVLISLALLMLQAPALVAGLGLAAALVRAGDASLAGLAIIDGATGCEP